MFPHSLLTLDPFDTDEQKPSPQTYAQSDLLVFTVNHLQQVKNKPITPLTAATASGHPLKNQRESGHSAILYLQRQNDLFK